jgi:TonB family protein
MNALAEFAWKSTVVLAAAFTANYALRRGSAAVRHFVWTTAFAVLPVLALMIGAGPRWEAGPAPAVTATIAVHAGNAPAAPQPRRIPFETIYAAGGALVLARFAIGIARTALLSRGAQTASHAAAFVADLRSTLRIARPVRALAGREIAVPMAWGILRPVALLPEASRDWPIARLRTVLLHELTHVKRHDLLAQLIAQFACTLFWFHPLVWLAGRQQRIERERACDDAVLNRGIAPAEYAGHLMELARSLAGHPAAPSVVPAMAETSDLESRVRALLDRGCNRAPLTRRVAAMVATVACALVLPVATLTTHAQQADRGALAGIVKDPSGARIPGATVTAKNLDGANVETVKTNAAGEYAFTSIPPGRYEVEGKVPGFALLKTEAVVTGGTAARADLNLALGAMSETVTVRTSRTAPAPQMPARVPERIPIGGNVQPSKLLRQVRPVYPEDLKAQGINGTVKIKAIISKTGDVLNPTVISTADPKLAQAVLDAVKQWQYTPTLLNGQPVEVLTTIDMTFDFDK